MSDSDDDIDWGEQYGDEEEKEKEKDLEAQKENKAKEIQGLQKNLADISIPKPKAYDFIYVSSDNTVYENEDFGKTSADVTTTGCGRGAASSENNVHTPAAREETTSIGARNSLSLSSLTINSHSMSGIPDFGFDDLPVNWTKSQLHSSRPFHLQMLSTSDDEYKTIYADFIKANVEVLKIERIENFQQLQRFRSEMGIILNTRKNDDYSLNIRYLYHGTSTDKKILCEEGLDQRLSCMGFFGKGIYFSDNPAKSVQYTENMDRRDQMEAYILRCRVILGDSKKYRDNEDDKKLKREPMKEKPTSSSKYYDSVIGRPRDHTEFVVYDNRRAMIEYVITVKPFKRIARANRPLLQTQSSAADQNIYYNDYEPSYEVAEVDDDDEEESKELKEGESDDDEQSKELQENSYQNASVFRHYSPTPKYTQDWDQPTTREETFYRQKPAASSTYDHTTLETYETGDVFSNQSQLNQALSEFMEVTDMNDIEKATSYIISSNLDVNRAIALYYKDL